MPIRSSYADILKIIPNLSLSEKIKDYNSNTWKIHTESIPNLKNYGIKFKLPKLILREPIQEGKRYVVVNVTDPKFIKVFSEIDAKISSLLPEPVELTETISKKYGNMRVYLPHKNDKLKLDVWKADTGEKMDSDPLVISENSVIDVLLQLRKIDEHRGDTRLIYEIRQLGIYPVEVELDKVPTIKFKEYKINDNHSDEDVSDFEYNE